MCVCDTQVLTGQRISTEYVTAIVSSGTGHSGILTRVLTITVDSTVVIGAGKVCILTSTFLSTVNDAPILIRADKTCMLTSTISSTVDNAVIVLTANVCILT